MLLGQLLMAYIYAAHKSHDYYARHVHQKGHEASSLLNADYVSKLTKQPTLIS